MPGALVWSRRDLRLDDNAALGRALAGAQHVFCAFVFGRDYPAPVVDHAVQRERALALYKKARP